MNKKCHTLDDIINILYQQIEEKDCIKKIEYILRSTYQSVRAEKKELSCKRQARETRKYLVKFPQFFNKWIKIANSGFWLDEYKENVAKRIMSANRKDGHQIYAVWNKTGVFAYYDAKNDKKAKQIEKENIKK